jgi:hypothetical protein
MVGGGVLLECLDHPDVTSILAIGRTSCGVTHDKLQEVLHTEFFDYTQIEERLTGYDACFFCLGVSAARMSEERYTQLTHDLTLAAAETLVRLNPRMTFCYISGTGADSTESGRTMWARVRGKTENDLMKLGFKASYIFRPGYIQPMKGIKSKTRLYRTLYAVFAPLYPIFKMIAPNYVTTTEKVGLAMIRVTQSGYGKQILENRDINAVAGIP